MPFLYIKPLRTELSSSVGSRGAAHCRAILLRPLFCGPVVSFNGDKRRIGRRQSSPPEFSTWHGWSFGVLFWLSCIMSMNWRKGKEANLRGWDGEDGLARWIKNCSRYSCCPMVKHWYWFHLQFPMRAYAIQITSLIAVLPFSLSIFTSLFELKPECIISCWLILAA